MPLISGRNARYMAENVPGVHVPGAMVERLESAGDGAAELGLELAYEFVETVRSWCAGVYLIPLLGRTDGIVRLVRQLRGRA